MRGFKTLGYYDAKGYYRNPGDGGYDSRGYYRFPGEGGYDGKDYYQSDGWWHNSF